MERVPTWCQEGETEEEEEEEEEKSVNKYPVTRIE